ncbi:hypothetical protein L1887_09341 [Cichorium endivia]|nr:hypothetical protein L1887_09341 [Cichorium endivia]
MLYRRGVYRKRFTVKYMNPIVGGHILSKGMAIVINATIQKHTSSIGERFCEKIRGSNMISSVDLSLKDPSFHLVPIDLATPPPLQD